MCLPNIRFAFYDSPGVLLQTFTKDVHIYFPYSMMMADKAYAGCFGAAGSGTTPASRESRSTMMADKADAGCFGASGSATTPASKGKSGKKTFKGDGSPSGFVFTLINDVCPCSCFYF
jgi:hypothetical protein